LAKRPEREEYLYYFEPPYMRSNRTRFYLKKGDRHLIKKYEDLYTLEGEIGVIRGAKFFKKFDDDKKINKKPFVTQLQLYQSLVVGRIKAVIVDEAVGDFYISSLGFKNNFEKADYFDTKKTGTYIVYSKKSKRPELFSKIAKLIKKMVDNGEMQKIKKDYLEQLAKDKH